MPRRARFVCTGVPHHVTQRGNHRERVFFSDGDGAAYLRLLRDHADEQAVEVVAYCLMPNHVHHVLIPSSPHGLHRLFKAVHGQYAQRVNRMRAQKGHLWQGRFFSSPLDADYFINAVRYVELNPVRAGIVQKAEDYAWSTAAVHCGLRNSLVPAGISRLGLLPDAASWSRWLADGLSKESIEILRRNSCRNLPCGTTEFVAQLASSAGRSLEYVRHGGPRPSRGAARSKQGERPLGKGRSPRETTS
jgi:putative transposase